MYWQSTLVALTELLMGLMLLNSGHVSGSPVTDFNVPYFHERAFSWFHKADLRNLLPSRASNLVDACVNFSLSFDG